MRNLSLPMRSTSNHGFSMLEAMVAVAISTVILLLAASAIRAASQSLRIIKTTAEENALLQRGWIEALQDVDFWNSHANPDFPYLAGPMSDTVTVAGSTDHTYDKRPFREVTFTPTTNPNVLLPNDPRSWYRGGLSVATSPVTRPAPTYEPTFVWFTTTDATASRPKNSEGNEFPCFPAGWAPWHITGDYTQLGRALGLGDGDTEFTSAVSTDAVRATTDFMPSLQWYLFSALGHTGVTSYLPNGAINLIFRPATNRTVANIGNSANYFDWGEVPWTLARGGPGGINDFSPLGFTVPSSSDFPGNSVTNLKRRNLLLGLPGSGSGMSAVRSSNLSANPTGSSSRYTNERSGFNTSWAMELESVSSSAVSVPGNWFSGGKYPHALLSGQKSRNDNWLPI
jgi:prepilin-type N-terminal cleavage/methylation domain-containing protein